FFFQAEDGIRDRNVTGVQTCALPIFLDGFREYRGVAIGQSLPRRRREAKHLSLPSGGPSHFPELRAGLEICAANCGGGAGAPREIGRASWRERVEAGVGDGEREENSE